MMSSSALFLLALLTIYPALFASLPPPADWLCRLARFLFGLVAIAWLVSWPQSFRTAWSAQELKLGHVSRVSRCWNAGVAPEVSVVFLAALEK